jgi:hypothetical protein
MIVGGKKAIADHLKAIHRHFYPIADHLNPIANGFYPIPDHLKRIEEGRKVSGVGFN